MENGKDFQPESDLNNSLPISTTCSDHLDGEEDLNLSKEEAEKLWEKTGFQRVLGGFWYNYIFNLAIMVFGLVILGVIFPNYILPFPEAMGFRTVVTSLFALMFTLFDVGIGSAVTRFVAEYVGKGQIEKSIEYLRFFIIFQTFTGLIQVTAIAVYALEFAKYSTTYAPLIWMFLIYSTVQYPGMLGIYNSALEAFQRYDKKNIVSFVQMVVFESTTQIAFIFIGRAWGVAHPEFGELMGATLGYIIGLYIDDFLAMLLAAKFFSDILKPYNISISETLIPKVSTPVIKKALVFGLKNMAQGIFYQVSNLFITTMTMRWLPNYATIVGLFGIADGITRLVIQDLPVKAAIAESYNCGKKKLTHYYSEATFKWYGILTFFLAIEIVQLVPPIMANLAGTYAAASWMIPYLMISRVIIGPIHFSDSVQQGCDKPEYAAYSLAVQMIARAISFWFFLSPNGLRVFAPNFNMAIAYCIADLPSVIAKNIFAWWIVDRKLYKVRINMWQTLGAPALSIIPLFFINKIMLAIFYAFSEGNIIITIIVAILILIVFLFGVPILFYFPMLGLMGGWDDRGLEHLKNAGKIAGPSKRLVLALYKTSKWGHDHSPLKKWSQHNIIPYEEADKEAMELNLNRLHAMKQNIN